jgi:hypothetical protein
LARCSLPRTVLSHCSCARIRSLSALCNAGACSPLHTLIRSILIYPGVVSWLIATLRYPNGYGRLIAGKVGCVDEAATLACALSSYRCAKPSMISSPVSPTCLQMSSRILKPQHECVHDTQIRTVSGVSFNCLSKLLKSSLTMLAR